MSSRCRSRGAGGAFLQQVELHRELSDLALKGPDLGFIVSQHSCLGLLEVELAAVVLRSPQLDQVGREAVVPARLATTNRAESDFCRCTAAASNAGCDAGGDPWMTGTFSFSEGPPASVAVDQPLLGPALGLGVHSKATKRIGIL